jgi:hypothetical protein
VTLTTWLRETTRDPLRHADQRGCLVCSYCGETLCYPVPGLDLDRVARAHYANSWRKHAVVTEGRGSLR